jgi:cysteine-rich repeat protein
MELHPSVGFRCYQEWTGVCGNGIVEPGEQCDDRNLDDFDGCSAACRACADEDGDGHLGPGCEMGDDHCDDVAEAWTPDGCAACEDADGDGFAGPGCDVVQDCDDYAPGITAVCQPDNGCPEGWVHIPLGHFEMGCSEGDPCWQGWSDESPRHTVTLSAYCLERTEVSVADYRACLDAGVCSGHPRTTGEAIACNFSALPGSRENHPLNCIDWWDARQYCQDWLGGDLPTEAQWEKAARGPDGRAYPWGDELPTDCSRCNWNFCHSSEAPFTWEVGSRDRDLGDSYYGLKDMAGNVWEWVLDCYDHLFYDTCVEDCTDPFRDCATGDVRGLRGGCYDGSNPTGMRAVVRLGNDPANKKSTRGFRCRTEP